MLGRSPASGTERLWKVNSRKPPFSVAKLLPPVLSMASFCPAGYESESDEEGFTFGDDEITNRSKNKLTNGDLAPGEAGATRGGFGTPKQLSNGLAKSSRHPAHLVHNQPASGDSRKSCLAVDDLRTAVLRGNGAAVEQLLEDGVDVNTVFSSGWTSLMYAANCAHADMVELLLEGGADANCHKDMYSALMAACASNKDDKASVVRCVEMLLDAKADVNSFDRYHMSPLMYAAREGHSEVTQRLVDCGANLDKQDSKGYTALIWASFRNHVRIVQILLMSGADISRQSIDGSRAVDFAFMNGHKKVEDLLKAHLAGNKPTNSPELTHGGSTVNLETEAGSIGATQVKESTLVAASSANNHCIEYGDLEVFLAGLGLTDFIQLFHHHQVELRDLLRMTDDDLQNQLKITQATVRKKILDGVKDTHVKDWEVTSLPQPSYTKTINCVEAVAMLANIKKHAAYAGSSVGYVSDQLQANRDILRNSQEGASFDELCVHTEDAITNAKIFFDELVLLRSRLTQMGKKESFKPPDLIFKRKRKTAMKRTRLLVLTTVILTGAAAFWHKDKIIDELNARLGGLMS